MSTTTTTSDRYDDAGSGPLTSFAASMKQCWAAYITWRMEQAALVVLRSMSDQELKDIGVARSEIARAVRRERPPRRALARE